MSWPRLLAAAIVFGGCSTETSQVRLDGETDSIADSRASDGSATDQRPDRDPADGAVPTSCLIDGQTYQAGAQHPTAGCASCDPAAHPTSWTVTAGNCLIDGACRASGEVHPDGCASCDPQKNPTGWTVVAGKCLVGGIAAGCHDAGTLHPTGTCAVCDPASSQLGWTVTDGCLINDGCLSTGTPGKNGCSVCDPARSTTDWSPDLAGKCTINYGGSGETRCYADGAKHFAGDCAICDVSHNPHAWTVVSGCLILDACHQAGEQRTFEDLAACGVCDPAKSQTDWTDIAGCEIPGYGCVADGVAHPWASCAACDASQSATSWSVLAGCFIADQCVVAGDQPEYEGDCAVCDPAQSQTQWTVAAGSCMLPDAPGIGMRRCYQSNEQAPFGCGVCDPAKSQTEWTVTGGGCLIDGHCFYPGDSCQFGIPGSTCNPGCWRCDPTQSKTSWTAALDQCADPMGMCFADGTKNTCATCDASTSWPSWQVDPGWCQIGEMCITAGDPEEGPAGCGLCDPARSTTAWSAPAGQCRIGTRCVADGTTDATGCLVCDEALSPRMWTPAAGATSVVDYSFDAGSLGGVTVSPAVAGIGWQLSERRAANGTGALWLGNPETGSSAGGHRQRAEVTLPAAALAAGNKAALTFMFWSDAPEALVVRVDETVVWFGSAPPGYNFDPIKGSAPWQAITVDLSAYAGSSVVVTFVVRTEPAEQQPMMLLNERNPEGIYLDAIRLVSGCT